MKIINLLLIILCVPRLLRGQEAPEDLSITHVTGDFYVYTTYHTYEGTPISAHGLYLVTEQGVVLIDTPWDSTQFQPLLDSIQHRHQQPVVMCIATHSHADRTAGLEYYREQGIKTYTSTKTDEISIAQNAKRAEFHFEQDTTFTVGQYSFETFYPGEGHTADNIVVWFEDERLLHGGCFVKSAEATDLGYIGEANLKTWPGAIKKITKKFGQPEYVIAGHQDWTDNRSLQHTLQLLKQHRKQSSR